MFDDIRIAKVEALLAHERFEEAEKILAELLAENPNEVRFLALMAQVKLYQDQVDEAGQLVESAIGLAPDIAHLFFIKAQIEVKRERYDEAEECITKAIELDTDDADYYAYIASIKLARKRFDEALKLADMGLEIDPENLLALNTRSTALNKLNRGDESYETIEGALRNDPHNAYTHANYGWGLLEQGDHKKAFEHFKESLSIDPNSEYAKQGLLNAIRATNPIYRLFLKYAFFMSNLAAKYQWGVIIGFYFLFQFLSNVAETSPSLEPFITPLLFILAIMAFSTWVLPPLSNLILRFNKYGRFLLTSEERWSANFVGISLAVFIFAIVSYFISGDERMIVLAGMGFFMMIPFGKMFEESRVPYIFLAFTLILLTIGVLSLLVTFYSDHTYNKLTMFFIYGMIGFQLFYNFVGIKKDNL